MAALTGKTPKDTYKDLLQVSNTNSGIDATLRPVEDGEGTQSPLELSSAAVNIVSGFQLGGTAITASAAEINYVDGVTSAIQAQIDGKVAANSAVTGATKTKITYDTKGLVTAGGDATTADIADSTDKRYVTDAQLTVLGNTSGTNTGDQSLFSTVAVSGQSDIVADSASDTLTVAAGSGISITTDAGTDTVTIASTVTQYTDSDAKAAAVADAINDGVTDVAPSQNAVFDALALKIPTSYLDTDTTLAADSDSRIATQKAVKAYADQLIAAANATVYKGATDCSANPNYPAADAGWLYRVSVAGKIGGASGVVVQAGDMFICLTDGTASGNQATVGANWNVIQANIDGAVLGPSSATDGNFTLFDGTTGKIVKNSAYSPASFEVPLTFSTGLTRTTNTVTVNTTQNIAKLSNLTSNGLVKTSGGDGTLSVDTNTYLTGNQTITLSGDLSGSGSTSISATIASGAVTLAKMADMATASFLGRNTAGSGAPEVLNVATAKSLLNLTGTNSGDQTITLTGDVTGSGTGSFAATIAANAVSNTKLRDSAALSVIGRSANSTGDPADISAGSDGQVLRRSGTTLGFGTVATAGITDAAVTYAKIQNVSATDRLLGRSSAGAGVVQEITCTAAGRNLLDDADAAAQRTTLGLGTAATQNTSAFEVPLTFTNGVTRSSNTVSAVAVGCKAYESVGSQAMGNLVYTAVTFRAEAFDSNDFHSTSSNTQKLVVPSGLGGKYLIVGVFWANYYTGANGTGSNVQTATNVAIDINGTQKAVIGLGAAGIGAVVTTESLSAGDEITMSAFHAYGSTLYTLYDAGGALNPSWYNLTAVWLGA